MAETTIRPGCSSWIGLNVLQVSSPPAHDQMEGKGGYIFASNTFYKQEPWWSFQSRNNVNFGANSTSKARLWSAAECSRTVSPLPTLARHFAQERLQSNVKRYYSTAISPELDDAPKIRPGMCHSESKRDSLPSDRSYTDNLTSTTTVT